MKILFFGDVIGKIGRRAIKKVLPELKEEYSPDLVIANAENLAHGISVTKKTLNEIVEAGIDFFTSGNHVFEKPEAEELLAGKDSVLIRPANYPPGLPGVGFKTVEIGSKSILIVSLVGRVFIKEDFDCPFRKIDEILGSIGPKNLAGIIIDFHAEATSEKEAFGWYVDGRASAVLGTHTHVPTADPKILPQGTAYISDIGKVGAVDSVIGCSKEPILKSFLTQLNPVMNIPEEGEVDVNAVLVEIDPKTRKAKSIVRVDKRVEV